MRTTIKVDAIHGTIAILKEIYGEITEQTVEEKYGDSFYYLVGKGENKFILYKGDIDKLLEYIKTPVPFLVNEMKDSREKKEVIAQIKSELNDPEYIKYIKTLANE